MLKSSPIPLACAAIILCGCSADNLYIAHKTNLGLNGTYNQAKPSGKFILGYKEQFLTVIPKSAPLSESAKTELGATSDEDRDAMAILSCSDVKVGFIELKEYSEYLATGAAARLQARKLVQAAGGPADPAAERLYAYRLRDKLGAAATAVDAAITAIDATVSEELKTEIAAVQAKLTDLINGSNETLSPGLALLEVEAVQPLSEKLAASGNAPVSAAGKDVQLAALQHSQAAGSAGELDSAIFSCFKNPENS